MKGEVNRNSVEVTTLDPVCHHHCIVSSIVV